MATASLWSWEREDNNNNNHNNNYQNNNQNLKNGKKSCAACSKRRSSAPTSTSRIQQHQSKTRCRWCAYPSCRSCARDSLPKSFILLVLLLNLLSLLSLRDLLLLDLLLVHLLLVDWVDPPKPVKRSESGVKWSESGGEWSRDSVRRCSIKKSSECQDVQVRCFGAAPIRCHSINIHIPPSYHPCRQYSKPCATPLCGPRPPFFVGRALLVPVLITLRLPQPRVQHILLHFHALRRLCAHASYQHSKNCDSGWSGGKLDWLHQGMQVPKLSLLSSLTALQLPGSGRLPLVRRDGEAAFRESLCETTVSVLACRRLPGSVLVLLHDMCEDDPRHFSP